MKKMMKLWTVVAVAAMGLTACQNNFDGAENIEVNNSVVVSFVAEPTKTSVDTSGDTPLFSWDENETFAVLEQTDALAMATSVAYNKVDGKANIDAEFAANADKGEYKYVAVYPASGYVPTATNINEATLVLPAEQSAVNGSYDPNADLMVSMPVVTTAQPTEAQPMRFTRLAAVAKMTINGLTLAADEVVECVEFTANGKNLAGTITADLEDPHAFTVNQGVSTVSVATTSASEVYFTVLPTTLAAGDAYSVAVATDKKVYIKQGVIPEGKSLVFEAGKVSRFPVNMTDAFVGAKWKLVRDASTLAEGDVVAIVAKDYDKALSTKLYSNAPETSTSARRDATDITKLANYLNVNESVQQLILVAGDSDNTFSFYDETRKKFLVSNNTSSRYLINQSYISNDTSFNISIDGSNGDATIKNVEGDYKGCMIRYYNSSKYFYSGTSTNQAVCIYRLEGAVGVIPVVEANITVPDSDKPVTIAEEGVAEATAIEEVVFNYVGDWTISVEDNADWLALSYADGVVSYIAEANTDAKREAVATITASLEGQESLSWTFNLVQKGAPIEISIEEFGKLSKDENSTYKLTGKVTTLATNATSSGYVLSDENGNTATIKYLDTEDGENVWGHDDFTIQLGDVMTVVAVPVGNKVGGNNSYPSIYKGHYRLSVSAGLAADYTGGSVAIEVATSHNGSIVLPTNPIAGTMEACDYASFAYTDGAASATVTFTSVNETSYAREATATFTYGLTSAEVTVQQGINPANKLGYEIVFDASTLAVGDEVIIVAKNADKALAKPTSTVTSQSNFPIAEISKTGSVIYDIEDTNTQTFTLASGNSENSFAFVFNYKDTDYHMYAPSSGLKGRLASSGANDDTSWSIEISSTDGDATIKNARPKVVKYNNATGAAFLSLSPTASNALKAEYSVCIYKKQVK